MKNFLLTSIIVASLLSIASCSGSGSADTQGIDTVSLTGELIIPYDHIKNPENIYASDDRIFLVNFPDVDTLIDEFTLDGKPVRSFLRKGQGPDEAAFIYSSHIDAGKKRLMMVTTQGELRSVSLAADAQPLTEKVFAYNQDKDKLNFSLNTFMMADNRVLSAINSDKGIFALFNPDATFDRILAGHLPESDFGEGLPEYAKINFLQPIGAVSPDGKHFVCYFGRADMTGFANIDGDSLDFRINYVAPPKGINVIVGDGYISFDYGDDYTYYFRGNVTASDSHAYMSYCGMLAREAEKRSKEMASGETEPFSLIRVYDFEGNIVRVLRTDVYAKAIAVSPDDKTLYALTENDDNGYYIVRYTLPSYN